MAAEIKSVKKKRATRRGRLTTLNRQLEEFGEPDIRLLDVTKLNTLRASIEKEASLHSELQAQYEELLYLQEADNDDESVLVAEADDGAEHQSLYTSSINAITTLLEHHKFFLESKSITSSFITWLDEADPTKDVFADLREAELAPLKQYLTKTESYDDVEVIKCGREEMKSLIKKVHAMSFSVDKSKPTPKSESDERYYSKRSTLDVELPSFHGNPLDWADFYALFSATMEKRAKHFSKEEKCCLLVKSLKDSRAKSLAQASSSGRNGYEDAIAALVERYGRPSIVLPHHLKRIKENRTLDFDRDSLLYIVEKQAPTFRALQDMDVDLSVFMAAFLSTQFTAKLSEEWSKHTASLSSMPKMEDLVTYARSIVCRLPSFGEQHSDTKSSNNSRNNNKQPSKSKKSSSQSSNTCALCQETAHSLTRCPVFNEYTPDRRGQFVREKKWCTNCLHPSHTVQNCPSSFTCRSCSGKHHSLLHRGDTTTSTNTTTANQVATMVTAAKTYQRPSQLNSTTQPALEPPTHAFLSTALVRAINGSRHRLSRLALDSGSSTSLITESLASHLKLKRHPQRLSLIGAYGGGTSKNFVQVTLQSRFDKFQHMQLKLSVVSKLPYATPPRTTEFFTSHDKVKDLQLADDSFGGTLDILLGNIDACKCLAGPTQFHPTPNLVISPTIFGWMVSGPLEPGQSSKFLSITTATDPLTDSLQRLWELDQAPSVITTSDADVSALQQFADSHQVTPSGRYSVSLPRVVNPPTLGQSRNVALSRFLQNEKSLRRKEKLTEFTDSLWEYKTLDHAEPIPTAQLYYPSYYLPVHGVFKDSSSTTKVRPVFDASMKTSSGVSLNDTLLTGPNLYPLLVDIVIQFRTHRIGFSADISKMFREIMLNLPERDFHRFLMRDETGRITDFRMKRLTFGVKPSPFLATMVIRHLATQHAHSHPVASKAILNHFYVDDFLSGADTVEQAVQVRMQLCALLKLAGMTLRKWRSSDKDFSKTIPEQLLEPEDLTLADAPKALGVHWNVNNDTLQIATPTITTTSTSTSKRKIASDAAKVYDVLGLFSPFVIRAKILLQTMWKLGLDWDDEAPEHLTHLWNEWISELPQIHNLTVQRRYDSSDSPLLEQSLHGFADASEVAYGAVVYLRRVHQDGTINTSIVLAKARVSPLKVLTIPKAELAAAHLLTKLLVYVAGLLDISSSNLYAWSDSTIVLCWLRKQPSSLHTFVANRVAYIQSNLPNTMWRHVISKENPADLLSRGVSANQLAETTLWWKGPPWLTLPTDKWTSQRTEIVGQVPEQRVVVLTSVTSMNPTSHDKLQLASRYSSFNRLARVLTWMKRFVNNSRKQISQRINTTYLLESEVQQSKTQLLKLAQEETYSQLKNDIRRGKNVNKGHPLTGLNLRLNQQQLLTASGRVRHLHSSQPKQLVVLSLKSDLAKLFLLSKHNDYGHPGVSTLLAIITEDFYVPGLKSFLKKLSRKCSICQKTYSTTTTPTMGLLPVERTTPAQPFDVTGLDFAGPLTIKQGHTRRPILLKAYVCVFVCFSTKAVHLELCSDLTTPSFMAALRRFCNRRGAPSHIHSDNGSNFVGAASELQQITQLLESSKPELHQLASNVNITWHFIPPRAPNFGGLWEAGVKQMKLLLRKQVTPHPLKFEELNTILTEIESILNSRPLTPLDATETELVLTPGHFLIGRPLKAPAKQEQGNANLSSLRRWNLVLRLQQDLWEAWKGWYLTTLQRRSKWNRNKSNIQVGDVVLLKDEAMINTSTNWPLARVTALYPGADGISRVADILCKGKTYRRAISRLVLITKDEHPQLITPSTSELGNSTPPPPEYVQVFLDRQTTNQLNRH